MDRFREIMIQTVLVFVGCSTSRGKRQDAALETERVLKDPRPNCLLRGFGDSSVNLELRIWLEDPEEGVGNVSSKVLLAVWHKYHAAGIAFPFPQRDLHIRSAEGLGPLVRPE